MSECRYGTSQWHWLRIAEIWQRKYEMWQRQSGRNDVELLVLLYVLGVLSCLHIIVSVIYWISLPYPRVSSVCIKDTLGHTMMPVLPVDSKLLCFFTSCSEVFQILTHYVQPVLSWSSWLLLCCFYFSVCNLFPKLSLCKMTKSSQSSFLYDKVWLFHFDLWPESLVLNFVVLCDNENLSLKSVMCSFQLFILRDWERPQFCTV